MTGCRASSCISGPPSPILLEDLVAANRILADQGVLDALGHVSVRHDRDPNRYLPFAITICRARGSRRSDGIHGEIYRVRPDAIVHTHAASLIPFGVSSVPLRAVHQSAAFIAQGVPIFDARKAAGMTDLLIRDATLGRALAQSLASHNAVSMRGHGAVVVAPSLPLVVRRSINLALNATFQMHAMALGGEIVYLDPQEAREVLAREDAGLDRAWEFWKRKAMSK